AIAAIASGSSGASGPPDAAFGLVQNQEVIVDGQRGGERARGGINAAALASASRSASGAGTSRSAGATHGRVQHEAAVDRGSARCGVGERAPVPEAPGPTGRAAGACAAGPALGQVPKEAGVADRCRGPEVHIDSATLGGTARAAGWIGAAPR